MNTVVKVDPAKIIPIKQLGETSEKQVVESQTQPKIMLDNHKLTNHLDRIVAWQKGENITPVTVEIGAASRCNQRCLFCGYDYMGHKKGVMDDDMILRISEQLPAAGVKGIVYAGDGEPFLCKALPEAFQIAKNAGADVSTSTNGVLLKPEMLPILADNLTWIRFSISGGTADDYATVHQCSSRFFEIALKNLAALVEEKHKRQSKLTIGVQIVLIPENIKNVAKLAKRVSEIGADYFVMKPFYHHDANDYGQGVKIDYDDYRDVIHEAESYARDDFVAKMRWGTLENTQRIYNRCQALPFFVYINPNGDVHPCLAHQSKEANSIGNLDDASFKEIWESDRKKAVFERFSNIDVSKCQPNCRHHSMNQFLWQITEQPQHVNFI